MNNPWKYVLSTNRSREDVENDLLDVVAVNEPVPNGRDEGDNDREAVGPLRCGRPYSDVDVRAAATRDVRRMPIKRCSCMTSDLWRDRKGTTDRTGVLGEGRGGCRVWRWVVARIQRHPLVCRSPCVSENLSGERDASHATSDYTQLHRHPSAIH